MSNWKCGRCGTVYSFDEFIALLKVPHGSGKAMVCEDCGYIFHQDTPIWKAYGEIKHHITCLHWLVNKLTGGRLASPHPIDIEISTVFLELAHNWFRGKPNWYESMVFAIRPEGKKIGCWLARRYRTEKQALEGHQLWRGLLEDGKYLITYALEKVDSDDPESKYRFEWRIDFSERHRRILHGAKLNSDFEGTAREITEE